MTKSELIKEVAKATGNPQTAVKEVVNSFLQKVKEATLEEGKVVLPEFGVFKRYDSAERPGRNPLTNEKITLKAKTSIKFKGTEI